MGVVVVCLAVAGCSAEPAEPRDQRSAKAPLSEVAGPAPEDTEPAPAAVDTAGEPTDQPTGPPDRPAVMAQEDEMGAVVAAAYFLALESYVLHTGDVAEWDRISAPDCAWCAEIRAGATALYSQGGRAVGGDVALGPMTLVSHDADLDRYAFEVPVKAAETVYLDAAGEVIMSSPAAEGSLVVHVVGSPEGWKFAAVEPGAEPFQ